MNPVSSRWPIIGKFARYFNATFRAWPVSAYKNNLPHLPRLAVIEPAGAVFTETLTGLNEVRQWEVGLKGGQRTKELPFDVL